MGRDGGVDVLAHGLEHPLSALRVIHARVDQEGVDAPPAQDGHDALVGALGRVEGAGEEDAERVHAVGPALLLGEARAAAQQRDEDVIEEGVAPLLPERRTEERCRRVIAGRKPSLRREDLERHERPAGVALSIRREGHPRRLGPEELSERSFLSAPKTIQHPEPHVIARSCSIVGAAVRMPLMNQVMDAKVRRPLPDAVVAVAFDTSALRAPVSACMEKVAMTETQK